jgi:F-type H+-transporting ATPase subunit O
LYGRYASALYSAASKQKSLDKVESKLKDFHATIAKDSRLAEFILFLFQLPRN